MRLPRYDPEWPEKFEEERDRLEALLGDRAIRVEHVGSTSVPGLQAKPVIDIQISVQSIDLPFFEEKLSALGYKHLPMEAPPVDEYPFFHKPRRWPTTHHIHLCVSGGDQEKSHLAFRNWLRTHSDDRDHYGALKDKLAEEVDESDVGTLFAYTEKKGAWVREITAKALRAGLADRGLCA